MSVEATMPSTGDLDNPEVAFETMSRKLAGLTAAIEGFAARQQELHARDYSSDLAKIHDYWVKVVNALRILDARPGLALTPEKIAPQIEAAGAQVRNADHQAWANANRELGIAIRSLDGVVASAATADKQRLWIIGVATATLVVGFALGCFLPATIAASTPESWHWPEQRAARVLQRDEWAAGLRLLQVSNPARVAILDRAMQLFQYNDTTLGNCRTRALQLRKAVRCENRSCCSQP